MVLLAIGSLIVGTLCGMFLFPPETAVHFSDNAYIILYLLMLSVGISVGQNKAVFRNMERYHWKVLLIPLGTIAASLAAAPLCALLTGVPMRESFAVVSGLGWYSLSGVMLTEYVSADMGVLAFMANLLREIFAFLLIPLVAKRCNHYTAIAPAAATSEDTTLAILIRYTSEEIVLMAVFNGVLCSAAVPLLIRLFYFS